MGKDTGTTKKSEELETIQYQYSKGLSIFACDAQDVFADVDVEVGQGLRTIKVSDTENDFHFAKRKETGAWVNTGLFSQGWCKRQQVAVCRLGRQSGRRCSFRSEPPHEEAGVPACTTKRNLPRKLQVRRVRLFRQFGGVLKCCLRDLDREDRRLQGRHAD